LSICAVASGINIKQHKNAIIRLDVITIFLIIITIAIATSAINDWQYYSGGRCCSMIVFLCNH